VNNASAFPNIGSYPNGATSSSSSSDSSSTNSNDDDEVKTTSNAAFGLSIASLIMGFIILVLFLFFAFGGKFWKTRGGLGGQSNMKETLV
jgi:hypothetical protein